MRTIDVGFTGTRNGMSREQRDRFMQLIEELCQSAAEPSLLCLRHGDCIGSDATAHELVRSHSIQHIVVVCPPIDPKLRAWCVGNVVHPEAEYLARDRAIVDSSEIMIATPETDTPPKRYSGTWYTVHYAIQQGKPVCVIKRDGTLDIRNC